MNGRKLSVGRPGRRSRVVARSREDAEQVVVDALRERSYTGSELSRGPLRATVFHRACARGALLGGMVDRGLIVVDQVPNEYRGEPVRVYRVPESPVRGAAR